MLWDRCVESALVSGERFLGKSERQITACRRLLSEIVQNDLAREQVKLLLVHSQGDALLQADRLVLGNAMLFFEFQQFKSGRFKLCSSWQKLMGSSCGSLNNMTTKIFKLCK